jgi:tetratricopeptide (TPR) repeat protein
MPEKKKTTASKSTDRRMTNPKPSKATSTPENSRIGGSGRSGPAAAAQPPSAQKQLTAFEAAMRFFHARQFREAREAFLQVRQGPERDIAHRADLHIRMCDRRLQEASVALDSAEDYYTYGVALINARNLAAAQEHLQKALVMAPDSDHVHYALALSKALSGSLDAAYEHLKRAIDLDPRNRIAARQDADFAPFANQPPLDALLYPDKRGW